MNTDTSPSVKSPAERWEAAIPQLFSELNLIAGFNPPKAIRDRFTLLHTILFSESHPCLAHLEQSDANAPNWLHRFRSGLLDSVQEGVIACCYHLSRIESVESRMLELAESHLAAIGPLSTSRCAGGGNTRVLNFEYQALVFSLRRTLEYIGVAVAAYFKTDCHSIRRLQKCILNLEPRGRMAHISSTLSEQLPRLAEIIPPDKATKRSVRDRLAHWEAVGAGCFNVSNNVNGITIGLVGGGHELDIPQHTKNQDSVRICVLGPVLRTQFENVNTLVWSLVNDLGFGDLS